MSHERAVDILLVEDDDGHAELIEGILRESGAASSFRRVSDGQEAIDYARCACKHGNSAHVDPMVVLLDVNMPRMDGIEVLRELRADPKCRRIPIIMLTTTDHPDDVDRCYEYGCNAYITKPIAFDAFTSCLRSLADFIRLVALPSPGGGPS